MSDLKLWQVVGSEESGFVAAKDEQHARELWRRDAAEDTDDEISSVEAVSEERARGIQVQVEGDPAVVSLWDLFQDAGEGYICGTINW